MLYIARGNTNGGSITVLLISCLTSLDWSVLQIKTKIVSCHTADSKPVKQEVNSTVILPPLVFPDCAHTIMQYFPNALAYFGPSSFLSERRESLFLTFHCQNKIIFVLLSMSQQHTLCCDILCHK
jgi:hypothetical protein